MWYAVKFAFVLSLLILSAHQAQACDESDLSKTPEFMYQYEANVRAILRDQRQQQTTRAAQQIDDMKSMNEGVARATSFAPAIGDPWLQVEVDQAFTRY